MRARRLLDAVVACYVRPIRSCASMTVGSAPAFPRAAGALPRQSQLLPELDEQITTDLQRLVTEQPVQPTIR